MKLLSTLTLATALFLANIACAKDIAGIQIADTIELENQPLQLNGAGVRSKFFMDLYIGSLYVPSQLSSTDAVLQAPVAVIRLNITSDMITADKMRDAITEGFELATADNTADIQAQIDTFMGLFSEEIKLGDEFTFATSKVQGVTAFKNGKKQATIEGEIFRQALLKIWLGDEPAQKSLKEAMLGK